MSSRHRPRVHAPGGPTAWRPPTGAPGRVAHGSNGRSWLPQLGEVRRPKAARPRWLEPSPKSPRSRRKGRVSRPKMDAVACTISNKENRGDNSHEGNRCDGPSCGNGRDEAGGAARAAGSDKRRHRSDSCVGIRPDGADVALDLTRS